NLVAVDAPGSADEMCEDGGVVAAARTDLHHRLAFLGLTTAEPISVRRRHADVDAVLPVQCQQEVLIEEGRIVVGTFDIVVATQRQPPRSWTGESLAADRTERCLDAGNIELGRSANQLRVERTQFFRSICHRSSLGPEYQTLVQAFT